MLLQALLVAALVIAITYAGHVLSAAGAVERPTWSERFSKVRYRTHEWQLDQFNRFELQLTVHAAAVQFGVNEGRMICVVEHESGWNDRAQNPTSTAAGLFQFVAGTWDSASDHYRRVVVRDDLAIRDGVSRLNGRAATLVAAFLMRGGQWFHWAGTGC